MSRAPAGRMQTVFKNARRVLNADVLKRIKTYDPGKELVPGITSVETNGHSFGHNSHVVASGNDKVFVQADVTHVPHLFARNPDWHAFYDQDGPKAEATRRRVYDMLVADRMMVQGFHYPFPGLAYVEKAGNGVSGDRGAVEPDHLNGAAQTNAKRKAVAPYRGGLFRHRSPGYFVRLA